LILTWFSPPLSFLVPDPRPSWAHLVSVHPRGEQPAPPALKVLALAQAVVEAELVLLSYRIRQMLE
jgi:hypothetical protein